MENKETKTKNIEIFMGTYEGKVICVRLNPKTKKTNSISFKSSENCLKVLKLQKNFLFATGNDEIIHIFDIKKLEDKGEIMSYNGTNNHLEIDRNFLLLGGSEKTISIWRMSDFSQILLLKGHQQSITAIKLHSSGRILLSASLDKSFIMWNMLTGIKIFRHSFSDVCQKIISFSKRHENIFVLCFEKEFILIDITKYSEGFNDTILRREQIDIKIIEIFCFKTNLYVFTSDNKVRIYKNLIDNECHESFCLDIVKPDVEEIRIKLITSIQSKSFSIVLIMFSNNELYIYDLNKTNSKINTLKQMKKFHSLNLHNERITCIIGKFAFNTLLN